jgi:solute carrier family 25 uncoupling protein 27
MSKKAVSSPSSLLVVEEPPSVLNDLTMVPPSSSKQQPQQKGGVGSSEGFLFTYTLSFLAACCSEFVTYPLDLIKARLQIQGEAALEDFNKGKATKVINKRGMLTTGLGIVREEGFFRLWQGMSPAIYRHVVYSGVRMTFYEFIRDEVLGKNPDGTIPLSTAVCGGVIAGGVAQFLASPADLVKVQVCEQMR